MSFSVSGTFGLLALGLLVSMGMVYTAGADGYLRVTDARAGNVDDLRQRGNTEIEMTRSVLELANSVGTVRVDVYNNGSTALRVNRTDVLVDGKVVTGDATIEVCTDSTSTSCDASRDVWEPGERLHVEVTKSAYFTDNPERVKIVTEHGGADTQGIEVL